MAKKKKLTDKQKLFIKEFIKDMNATKAAERAGYSKRSARKVGSQNMAIPEIKEAIEKQRQKVFDKVELNSEWVLTRLMKVADINLENVLEMDENDIPKIRPDANINELFDLGVTFSETESSTVSEKSESTTRSTSRSFRSSAQAKMKALEILAKHTGVTNVNPTEGSTKDWKSIAKRVSERLSESARRRKRK